MFSTKSLSYIPFVFLSCWLFGEEPSEGGNTTVHPSVWEAVKGEGAEDQILMGMFSLHLKPASFKSRNWNQELLGLQIHHVFVSTFINSFDNRTWALGIARNFTEHPLGSEWESTFGYRLGLLYGYEEGEAPFSSASPVIPLVGIYKQYIYHDHLGVEFMLTSLPSVSFFYQF